MKMSEAVKGFLLMKTTEYSPNTLSIYEWALTRITQFLHDPEVEQITEMDLQNFFIYLQKDYVPTRRNGETGPLKPRSIENAWTAMRSFFNWITPELGLKNRPDTHIKRPRYKPAEVLPYTEDEIKILLKACERTKMANTKKRNSFAMRRPTARRDVAILLVLLDTGLRVSECARLLVKDVNLETGEVFVSPWGTGQKTKSRIVLLGRSARKAVWRYLSGREDPRPEDPLFVSEEDRPMSGNSIRLMMGELGKRTGVKDVHPHRFRHTFAIQFLRNGGDVFSLQRFLGHSSLEMVQHYLSLAQIDLEAAHRKSSPADHWRL